MGVLDNWITQVRKGILDLCILNALKGQERYGYDLVKSLCELPGMSITEGTIYPLLSRLRLQGLVKTRLVESPEGPARKYYSLTQLGERNTELMMSYLETLLEGCRVLRGKRDEP